MSFSTIPPEVWEEQRRQPQPEPDQTSVPYYRPGKPRPEQLLTYWQARALRAEAEVKLCRQRDQIREGKKQR